MSVTEGSHHQAMQEDMKTNRQTAPGPTSMPKPVEKSDELPRLTEEENEQISEMNFAVEEQKAHLVKAQTELQLFSMKLFRKYKMKPELHSVDFKTGKFVKQ